MILQDYLREFIYNVTFVYPPNRASISEEIKKDSFIEELSYWLINLCDQNDFYCDLLFYYILQYKYSFLKKKPISRRSTCLDVVYCDNFELALVNLGMVIIFSLTFLLCQANKY